ncbi:MULTISPECIES: flagellar hook capping FlgD N-terminal domain-containing protein [Rhodopseudomonas]|uniref:Basal-body rod modification protein FlgD n=1 Tax=Rhodopseudomonas palustris TaxID=1076 RepID=A0A0D7DY92_RHOPL|nr:MULTISPECIES: flagellar hook capping FlgD N-terminal domain-containing protein [Rhodopseudomonas]KIZ33568.1 flagellar hook capping protein FlgD [Rhodopseudomonas palustris]MDF3813270.1 flagellar hook capping FlgD N-terminal domain-containing protein [Rhodopseudomonas sp. BAL398]WOK17579.1 flagellar hook capping FlgD N-terminal domain-containing protein [Rhodopseudomonas sp. BAL398]
MAIDATTVPPPVSGVSPVTSSTDTTTKTAGIADNFQTFLTLLTTQLKNQNPLDPLDTNQFTQQLVQFAGVEQQLKSNDALASLVKLQSAAQSTQALNFVGTTAVVDGSTTSLDKGVAAWGLSLDKPSSVKLTISNSTGQTVFQGNYAMSAGKDQSFVWDGKGNDGTQWPDGNYTISAVGTDAAGQNVAVSSEIHGVVDSADLSTTPPKLSIGGQTFTLDQVKKVVRAGT